jgi:hypothetical protein
MEEKKDKSVAGLLIPAGLFIGMGFGFLLGNLPAGLFIGLGAGFAGFAWMLFVEKKRVKR